MQDKDLLLPELPKPEPRDSRPHSLRVRLDVIALCVAALGALFAFLQWKANMKQATVSERALADAQKSNAEQAVEVQRARQAAETSAKAATALADIAKQSLSISERGARASERSAQTATASLASTRQLFAEGRRAEMSRVTTIMQQFEAGKPIKYDVHFLNAGPTRAVNVTTVTSPLALPVDQRFPSNPQYNTSGPPRVSIVLSHEHIVQHGEGDIVSPGVFEGAKSGVVRVYIHGKVEYDDADARHHTTTFCDYYKGGATELTACPVYNNAN